MTWTAEETATLMELVGDCTIPEIAKALNRTYDTVYWKIRKLKLTFHRLKRPWSKREENQLMKWAGEIPAGEISRRLNRPENSISAKASKMGLSLVTELNGWSVCSLARLTGIPRSTFRNWVKKKFLKTQTVKPLKGSRYWITRQNFSEFYHQYRDHFPSLKLIPPETLEWLIQEPTVEILPESGGPHFSQEEDDKILRYAGYLKVSEIAEMLNRPKEAVKSRAKRLNIPLKLIYTA